MKVLSMYLPQFHKVPENDEWWGEGFTDWVSTKNAKPLFDDHYQPHIPLHDNYYDLLDKATMEWQADLMKQYGIDGVAIYHYWFKDGRQILEKPVNNLLNWKDIDMPFCMYWANETWARSWSNIVGANAWTELQERYDSQNKQTILLEQKYGEEAQWKMHFDYLLPFFKDGRYIKMDNKPVFLIYKSKEIHCLKEMMTCWNQWAIDNGFNGIYLIAANFDETVLDDVDAILFHEPAYSLTNITRTSDIDDCKISYEDFWESALATEQVGKKAYYSGVVGFDDTPRRGNRGWSLFNATPEMFKQYLTELMAKSAQAHNKFVFINAWNEWGEGMHLEPDERYGYKYLEAVKTAKNDYKNITYYQKNSRKQIEKFDKFERYMNAMDKWMTLRENGIHIADYLKSRGYLNIAIYGYGMFGRHLFYELQNTDIVVSGIIDRQKEWIKVDAPTFGLTEEMPIVDAVIVTSFFYMNKIKQDLIHIECPLISMESIIDELL